MDSKQWQRIEEILNEAIELEFPEQERFVQISCAGDNALMVAVQRLLAAEDCAGAFLEEPLSLQDDQGFLDLIGAAPSLGSVKVPDRIGRYEIVRVVGVGGMGTVFEAWDARLHRRVAIKVLNEGAVPGDRLKRLRREARILARLDHPSLVSIYEILETGGSAALVMELVGGTPLSDLISAGELTCENVVLYSAQIASGLNAAHEASVVHRDLKAENIKISNTGVVRILDFGIARIDSDTGADDEEHLTGDGQIIGSASALSPEQVRGCVAGPASDLFALGTLVYQMLTGEHPFADASFITTMQRINRHTPPPVRQRRPDVPVALERVVTDLLEKAIERRLGSAADLEHRLLALLKDPAEDTPPAQPRARPGHRTLVLSAVFLTILIGLLVFALSTVP